MIAGVSRAIERQPLQASSNHQENHHDAVK